MLSEQMTKAIKAVFDEYGEKFTEAAKEALAQNKRNATNALSDSFTWRVSVQGETITLSILAENYMKWVEEGRRPGEMPPINLIVKWIQYKGFSPRTKTGTRHGIINAKGVISYPGTRRGNSVIIRRNVKDSNLQMAFAIAKTIMNRGTRGTAIIRPLAQTISTDLNQALLTAVKKSIDEDFADIWKEGQDTNFITYTINF